MRDVVSSYDAANLPKPKVLANEQDSCEISSIKQPRDLFY